MGSRQDTCSSPTHGAHPCHFWPAEVISTVGFEKDLDALRVETGSNGKIQLAHQPFLEVSLQLLQACCSVFDHPVLPVDDFLLSSGTNKKSACAVMCVITPGS